MLKRSVNSLGASLGITILLWFAGAREWLALTFIFSSAFAFFVNLEIGLRPMKGNLRLLGGKFAHIGIAIMFLGIIATGKYSSTKHLSLAQNTPQEALGYTFTYIGYQPTADGKFEFNVSAEKDGKTFQISPVMFDAGEQGLMRNPDIASFLTRDVYLSPVSLDQPESHAEHRHEQETYTLPKGEAVSMGGVKATFVKFYMNAHATEAMTSGEGMAIGSVLELSDGATRETITPIARYGANGEPTYESSPSKLINGRVQLVSMNVGMGPENKSTVTVAVDRGHSSEAAPETLVVEASIKPYINLLWGGTVLMIAGFILAIVKRTKEA